MSNPQRQSLRFSDIAQNINERILPQDAEGLPYVGLEHLDSESLKIRRWGTPDEVEAQKLRFYVGDIIFGKRRYYQKKLAVADFDGICSAHAMVLRAKPEVVLPEFLPFFMQSELFYERAMSISVGSLSPTINWSALARQEFSLPPLSEQRRIADLLWAAEECIERYRWVLSRTSQLLDSYISHVFSPDNFNLPAWQHGFLEQLCNQPITYGIVQAGEDFEGGVYYVRVSDMVKGNLSRDGMLRTSTEIDAAYARSRVHTNDIIIALRGQPGLALRVTPELDGVNLSRGVAKVSLSESIHADYVLWVLRSPFVLKQLQREQKGSTFQELNLKSLRDLVIPFPLYDEQKKIAATLEDISRQVALCDQHLDSNIRLKGTLLSHLIN